MYEFYISSVIATEILILPVNQMMVRDQIVVFCFCLEFHETTFSSFGVMSEAI